MAAPTLFAEGSDVCATSGTPGLTLPSHQADDILCVLMFFWGPSPGTVPADIPTPSSGTWNLAVTQVGITDGTNVRGKAALFWKRATSGAEGTGFARGSGWDTGTDTAYYARGWTVRGCITTGDPFDEVDSAGPFRTANQNFDALTVSAAERMAVQFGCRTEITAFGAAPGGWTAGASDTNTGGTDGASRTYRQNNISSDTSAAAPTVSAVTVGGYVYFGVSFKPPAAADIVKDITAALETDAAQALSFTKAALTKDIIFAAEIDAAQALGFTKTAISKDITAAVETDVAQGLDFTQAAIQKAITAATETDVAQTLTFSQSGGDILVDISPATEADVAQALSFTKQAISVNITPATETDVAQAVSITQIPITKDIEAAAETDSAQALAFVVQPITKDITAATEIDQAQPLSFEGGVVELARRAAKFLFGRRGYY